jgi:hypothetical protein
MRLATITFVLSCLFATSVSGQSTISDEPFELIYGSGPMGILSPSYRLGTDASGRTVYQDDGDTFGGLWKLEAVRRFLGTRTSFETSAFYGFAEANSNGSSLAANIPNPVDGSDIALGPSSTHLKNKMNMWGIDVALRDTWRTRFGGLSAGAAFSYMYFDQEFKVDRGTSRIVNEGLDHDYIGGKGFIGWDGCICGRRSKLDFAVGYFDLDVDYQFNGSATVPGTFTNTLADTATTVEGDFTTYFDVKGYNCTFTVGALYISEFGQIVHDPLVSASLRTDDAVLITGMVQISL